MLKLWQAVLLGMLQGLTEFLPVSSSGHLVLFEKIFGVETGNLFFFNCMLHLGTLAAVILYYKKDVLAILKKPFAKMTWMLVIATIPAVVATVLLGDALDVLFAGKLLGLGFLLTAAILFVTEIYINNKHQRDLTQMNWLDALFIGIAQAFAIMPGVSRSGATISAGLGQGFRRAEACRFAMLLSMIAAVGGVVLDLPDVFRGEVLGVSAGGILLGLLASFISGMGGLLFLDRVLRKKGLKPFAWYMALLGTFVLLDQLFLHIIF